MPKLFAHGWKSTDDFTYVQVLERPEVNLWKFVTSPYGREQGSSKLIASRVFLSLFETVENIHKEFGVVLANVDLENMFIRPDWQTGFAQGLDL